MTKTTVIMVSDVKV